MTLTMERIDLAETDREREDAVFKMIIDALDRDRDERRKVKKLCIICASLCIIALLSFCSILAVLASGINIETTNTESTVTQETSGEGDAVYQAGDGSSFYAGESGGK